jgi:phosphoserine phosphatase RsbU/P
MSFRSPGLKLDISAGLIRRALKYATYDWTREMSKPKRLITWAGMAFQGYAIYALLMWAWMVPNRLLGYLLVPPRGVPSFLFVVLLSILGFYIMNGMLASEFVRKTQLEADLIAARQIQQTLYPQKLEELPGYKVETLYRPFRDVGGDYFDVIELPNNRTLFAVADVSGKAMPAALLAANLQALVRSIASVEADPLAMARQINKHLSRYISTERYATAVFVVLNRDTGELTYVNAGHNAPLLYCSGSTTFLQATGLPLGLFTTAEYETATAVIAPGGTLLLFTDGLTDSISGNNPTDRLSGALADNSGRTMATLEALVDPKLNEDDVTILLLQRGL